MGEKATWKESEAVKFSVITACRNSASLLPETIKSVVEQSALTQGIADLEVLHHRRRLKGCDRGGRLPLPSRADHVRFRAGYGPL